MKKYMYCCGAAYMAHFSFRNTETRKDAFILDLNEKLEQVCRLFRIEDTYLGYETIQTGNVNHTYKVNFRLSDGREKSFLVQNVNTYALLDLIANIVR